VTYNTKLVIPRDKNKKKLLCVRSLLVDIVGGGPPKLHGGLSNVDCRRVDINIYIIYI
jgi:hypothetical protein